eukprot:1939790-Alexandrium_andersonii.AAC.1
MALRVRAVHVPYWFADNSTELHAQLIQDRLGIERQPALAARATNERLIRPQANTTRRKRLLEYRKHVQGTDSAAAKGVA